jgi:hypothetical protein
MDSEFDRVAAAERRLSELKDQKRAGEDRLSELSSEMGRTYDAILTEEALALIEGRYPKSLLSLQTSWQRKRREFEVGQREAEIVNKAVNIQTALVKELGGLIDIGLAN